MPLISRWSEPLQLLTSAPASCTVEESRVSLFLRARVAVFDLREVERRTETHRQGEELDVGRAVREALLDGDDAVAGAAGRRQESACMFDYKELVLGAAPRLAAQPSREEGRGGEEAVHAPGLAVVVDLVAHVEGDLPVDLGLLLVGRLGCVGQRSGGEGGDEVSRGSSSLAEGGREGERAHRRPRRTGWLACRTWCGGAGPGCCRRRRSEARARGGGGRR